MNKKRQLPVVWVRWVDASQERGPMRREHMQRGVTLETAGLLVDDTGDYISLALDSFVDDESYRDIAHIPKINILAKKVWKP